MIVEWIPAIGLSSASSLQLPMLFPPPLSVFPPRCPPHHSIGHMPLNIIQCIGGLFRGKATNPLARLFPPNMPSSIRQCFVAILFVRQQCPIANKYEGKWNREWPFKNQLIFGHPPLRWCHSEFGHIPGE